MIYVTPLSLPFSHEDSQASELMALRQDLIDNSSHYLNHENGWIRSEADWAMEYFKIRNIRRHLNVNEYLGNAYLLRLYTELRYLANTEEWTTT
jgi:hypothetical protein